MSDLPEARWGDKPLPDWRMAPPEDDPDDEELAETPADVIEMLGFDPLDEQDEGRADALLTKAEVEFGPGHANGDHCAVCTHFRPPNACAIVAGEIGRVDWCDRFDQVGTHDEAITEAEDAAMEPKSATHSAGGLIHAAGLMLLNHGPNGDRILFVKNADRDTWEFPGGVIEDGESAEDAAVREVKEEVGTMPHGRPTLMMRDRLTGVDYSTFIATINDPVTPRLSDELTDYVWASPQDPPQPLHPGTRMALARMGKNELDIAREIAEGTITSPQVYENIWLYAIRISGTGLSMRPQLKEHVFRDPKVWLSNDTLERCNGLSVVWEHPPGMALTTDEYRERVIGAIMLPYVVNDELWGVAKVHDQDAALEMLDMDLSTSPGVVFRDQAVNEVRQMPDGTTLLIEGNPSLLDHVAICALGVWDKGGQPTGVAKGDPVMAASEPSIAELIKSMGEKMDTALGAINVRLDAIEEKKEEEDDDDDDKRRRDDARKRVDAFKFTPRKDDDDDDKHKARRDAEEEALEHEYEEAGEEEGKAKEMASDRRKKADDDDAKRAKDNDDDDDDDDDDDKHRRDDARKRADAFTFHHDDDDDDRRAKRDAEEEELAKHYEEAGESKDDARKHAHDRRMRADDDDDKKRRHDAALDKRLRALERSRVRTDEEFDQLAELQTTWSEVSTAHGARPSRPLDGERPATYDRRMAKQFQKFSTKWGEIDLSTLPIAAQKIATSEIRADALREAYNGKATAALPGLREIRKTDDTGRVIREFVGNVDEFLAPFRIPAMRVRGINTNPDRL